MRAAALFLAGVLAFAQERPAFEVASIKGNPDAPFVGLRLDTFPDGRLSARNVTVFYLLRNVWALGALQISGGPAWVKERGFDIQAQPAPRAEPISRSQIFLMLQSLLEDRFKLKWHRETREVSAYALKVVDGGSKLGPPRQARGSILPGNLDAPSTTIGSLLATLEPEFDRPVIDQTGLAGPYSIHLAWASERALIPDQSLPSLFTAMQEQLGLRLEPTKVFMDIFVIESVAMPSEN
ncbi:MAG: TIGR03435 family protein [Bryobacteraceae bacterium]